MTERILEAQKALEEIKSYNLARVPRKEELGQAFDFRDAVEPARKIQALFGRIPAEFLSELSDNFVSTIYNQCMAYLNILCPNPEFRSAEKRESKRI